MRTIRLVIRYDGGAFSGWQRQPGFRTVQQVLEESVEAICGQKVVVHGAGRTDSGVHALAQVAHFRARTHLADPVWVRALNAHVGVGVAVIDARTMDDEFHARFSAIGKRYAYLMSDAPIEDPLTRHRVWWLRSPLELARMRSAARHLVGRHDWRSFQTTGSSAKTSVRTVRSLHLWRRGPRIAMVVEADGFLYNMVRAFAGTLAEVGRGALDPEGVYAMREARDRRAGGPTAPAHGLYLLRALYPRASHAAPPRYSARSEFAKEDVASRAERIPFD